MGLIRVILAISVITAHSSDIFGLNFVGGEMAVKLFFMISGFYMALVLNEKYTGVYSGYWLFVKNRLLRLYPLYFLILLLTIAVGIWGYHYRPGIDTYVTNYMNHSGNFTAGTSLYLGMINLLIVGLDTALFFFIDMTSGQLVFTSDFMHAAKPETYKFLLIPQAWSISMELCFYFIAPFIVRKLKIILILSIASAILALVLYLLDFPNDPWNYRFFPAQLFYFLMGSGGYFLYKLIRKKEIPKVLYGTMFVITMLVTGFYSHLQPLMAAWIIDATIVLLYFISIPLIFNMSKKWLVDRFIGELSYSIYLIHILVLLLIRFTGITHIWVFGLGEMAAIISIVLSIIIQKTFLERIEKYRQL